MLSSAQTAAKSPHPVAADLIDSLLTAASWYSRPPAWRRL